MKRVKVMLTAICVLAMVGGALAFKAKTFGNGTYCTTTAGGGNICPVFSPQTKFTAPGNIKYVRVFAPNCSAQPVCTSIGLQES